jgi:hypothetical protein
MPPKKAKIKVRKSSKTAGGKGVNIKIVIDQSKKTKGQAPRQAPKATTGMRQLPAFSAMPQGSSFLGASYPTRQDAPSAPPLDVTAIGDRVFNQLLAESNRIRQGANGFGGFQTSGQQLNQIYDGQYSRVGRNNAYIISNPDESSSTKAIDNAIFEDPETHNQILGNKLNNRGSQLPHFNENSIGALDDDERRDNNLDNLVLHEKKSKAESTVNADLDEDLLEEDEKNESYVLQEVSPRGEAQRSKELALEAEEAQYTGKVATKAKRDILEGAYNLPTYPPPKKASLNELKEYIRAMNKEFGTNYDTDFKGRNAVDDLRRVIRVGLLKAYDDL